MANTDRTKFKEKKLIMKQDGYIIHRNIFWLTINIYHQYLAEMTFFWKTRTIHQIVLYPYFFLKKNRPFSWENVETKDILGNKDNSVLQILFFSENDCGMGWRMRTEENWKWYDASKKQTEKEECRLNFKLMWSLVSKVFLDSPTF